MASFESVSTVLRDTAVLVGLGSPAAPWDSTDNNVLQLRGLLTVVGRGLIRKHAFLQNLKEHTFATTGATTYAYPSDFLSIVGDSSWDRTSHSPLVPVFQAGWQRLKANQDAVPSGEIFFRPTATGIELHQTPASGLSVAYTYRSSAWVKVGADPVASDDRPGSGEDILCIDSHLLVRALRHAYLEANGFESSGALQDLHDAFQAEAALNGAASPVLSLVPAGLSPFANNTIVVGSSGSSGSGFGVLY